MIERDTIGAHLAALASKSPTPGGGAAAGICGAEACALVAMVCRLTRGSESRIGEILELAEKSRARFISLADQDVHCFEGVMQARRLPKDRRADALQYALKAAADVPLSMAEQAVDMIEAIGELEEIGNPNLVTDVGIASLLIEATIRASSLNVLINTGAIADARYVESARERLSKALASIPRLEEINDRVDRTLHSMSQDSSPSAGSD